MNRPEPGTIEIRLPEAGQLVPTILVLADGRPIGSIRHHPPGEDDWECDGMLAAWFVRVGKRRRVPRRPLAILLQAVVAASRGQPCLWDPEP